MNDEDFDKYFKKIQLKFQKNKQFQEDFIVLLRWLTKKWKNDNLSKLEISTLEAIK